MGHRGVGCRQQKFDHVHGVPTWCPPTSRVLISLLALVCPRSWTSGPVTCLQHGDLTPTWVKIRLGLAPAGPKILNRFFHYLDQHKKSNVCTQSSWTPNLCQWRADFNVFLSCIEGPMVHWSPKHPWFSGNGPFPPQSPSFSKIYMLLSFLWCFSPVCAVSSRFFVPPYSRRIQSFVNEATGMGVLLLFSPASHYL